VFFQHEKGGHPKRKGLPGNNKKNQTIRKRVTLTYAHAYTHTHRHTPKGPCGVHANVWVCDLCGVSALGGLCVCVCVLVPVCVVWVSVCVCVCFSLSLSLWHCTIAGASSEKNGPHEPIAQAVRLGELRSMRRNNGASGRCSVGQGGQADVPSSEGWRRDEAWQKNSFKPQVWALGFEREWAMAWHCTKEARRRTSVRGPTPWLEARSAGSRFKSANARRGLNARRREG